MTGTLDAEITIRPARTADERAIARLAALDSAVAPADPLMLGEVDGALWVAMSLLDGSVVADPFAPTADLVELVRVRVASARADADEGPAGRRGLRLRWRTGAAARTRGQGVLALVARRRRHFAWNRKSRTAAAAAAGEASSSVSPPGTGPASRR